MDNMFFDDSIIYISNGLIDNVTTDNRNRLVTVSYSNRPNSNRREQTVRLVVNNRTLIFDEFGNTVPTSELVRGMIINAAFSSAMTRSIPPQANAYMIRIVRRPASDNIVTGRIIDVDRESRMFTTITGNNPSSIIRFSVPSNARIFDMQGRPMSFARLFPGLRVQVRHASFMTASIPPQTTAREIRVL